MQKKIINNMYVRIPSDFEDDENPRIFICGQVKEVNYISEIAKVQIHDPFNNIQYFPNLKNGIIEEPLSRLDHCKFFENSRVIYKKARHVVLSSELNKETGYYCYYIQNLKTKQIVHVSEDKLIASFDNGKISPILQLANYEFQNPVWYSCRSTVAKNLNILDNSIVGFKDLAGCKIFLLPHQVNTIMRCFQSKQCRYMLADEVGMGKTIEALSVYKLFIKNKYKAKSLILVPEALEEQWKIEMYLKFNILPGVDHSDNELVLKTPSQLSLSDKLAKWNFVIVDEIHNYLNTPFYDDLYTLSKNADNILLLSATPVQQREKEYLELLKLLSPEKYGNMPLDYFVELISKQKRIVQRTTNALEDLEDYFDEIESVLDEGDLPEESDDCRDIFDELLEEVEELAEIINDDRLNQLIEDIDFDIDGYGVSEFQLALSYVSSNYQIENSIIRNRRKIFEVDDDDERQMPIRNLKEISYDLDPEKNYYENAVYKELIEWLTTNKETLNNYVDSYVNPILSSYFSSVFALKTTLKQLEIDGKELLEKVDYWYGDEINIFENVNSILDDPEEYEDKYNSRVISVLNFLYEDIGAEKVVLFTEYIDTFNAYEKALKDVFGEARISTFSKSQSRETNELNAYRFQNDAKTKFLLCDSSGGEGRNFQCADYVVHIDLPWDANIIEQRIGRLDRLERDPSRPIVNSVVIHTNNTFENELFNFWDQGLNIFKQSLSGMEIIMNDINSEIKKAVEEDIEYQLADKIPEIIKLSKELSEEIDKERNFDATAVMYRPMFIELKKLITYYSENENSLFTRAMSSWAKMAGFQGSMTNGIITYSPKRFSLGSAAKSLLIPPRFDEYILSAQNQFITKVTNMYSPSVRNNDRSIRGTFERKRAIENDYIHFFAPGDAIFDCIIDNAMNSCKGCASSFAFQSDYNWKGFVFTFKLQPDIISVLKQNESVYLLNSYRQFLCHDMISIAVPTENYDDISEETVIRELNSLFGKRMNKHDFVSFGKRGRSTKFLTEIDMESSNIEWFKENYPEDSWKEVVVNSYKIARKEAMKKYVSRSNLKGAVEEMKRQVASRKANLGYYNINDDSINELIKQSKIVINALKNSKVELDSVCYIWMVK